MYFGNDQTINKPESQLLSRQLQETWEGGVFVFVQEGVNFYGNTLFALKCLLKLDMVLFPICYSFRPIVEEDIGIDVETL